MDREPDDQPQDGSGFDWTQARWSPLYPPIEILAEMGRVAVAAARVDRQLALALLAIKHPDEFDELLKRNSSMLLKELRRRTEELFEGQLLSWALANINEVQKRIEARHAVAHSIWTPADRSEFVSVQLLAEIGGQDELDRLLAERGSMAEWKTHHPKANGPGLQSMHELEKARVDLEDAATWLEGLRFTLASALFAGKPPGARNVLDPDSFN
ncbi:hypothetical protein [Dactylosporangium sp. NPDC006015]|uniref:hypothetical protein n=1 Tax=Dactylosporangium sp. NPDC006015 TaxID=3154576 RepID=UPI0033BD2655